MGIWDVFLEGVLILSIILVLAYIFILKKRYAQLLKTAKDDAAITEVAFEKTAVGMCIALPDLTYVDINAAYCNIVGYSKEELMNITHKDFIHPEDQENDTPLIRDMLMGKYNSFQSVKRYIHKKGYIVWAKATVTLVRDEDQSPKFFVTQIQDITLTKNAEEALKRAKAEAEKLACTDYLTGCLNRRAFMARVEEEVSRAIRNRKSISLILVDIDDFKLINDLYGHLAGDYVLRQFAKCLNSGIRTYDFIGRFGGEEFIICLPDTNLEEAYLIAERMRQSIEEMVTEYEDLQIKITGSFGVATSHSGVEEPVDKLIGRADKAMYEAKELKNKVNQSA